MEKTTVYLPDELKSQLKRTARLRGVSEATVIRDAIRVAVSDERPRPRGGLFAGSEPIAERAEELLDGFGERPSSTATPTSGSAWRMRRMSFWRNDLAGQRLRRWTVGTSRYCAHPTGRRSPWCREPGGSRHIHTVVSPAPATRSRQ